MLFHSPNVFQTNVNAIYDIFDGVAPLLIKHCYVFEKHSVPSKNLQNGKKENCPEKEEKTKNERNLSKKDEANVLLKSLKIVIGLFLFNFYALVADENKFEGYWVRCLTFSAKFAAKYYCLFLNFD